MDENKKNKKCQKLMYMIISFDLLNKDDREYLNDHLKECKSCREYHEMINNISYSMKVPDFRKMQVDDKIRKKLIQQVKKMRETSWLEKIWLLMNRCFQYKIPVYQSVLAFIIIFFTIYGIKSIQSPQKKDVDKKISIIDTLKTYPVPAEYQYVIENMDIIGAQKKGESIMEDSSFVSYSYPIL